MVVSQIGVLGGCAGRPTLTAVNLTPPIGALCAANDKTLFGLTLIDNS